MMIDQNQPAVNISEASMKEKGCYTVDDVMEILDVGRKAVYSLIRRKAFPAIRIGSAGYRIPKDGFNAWMYQQRC